MLSLRPLIQRPVAARAIFSLCMNRASTRPFAIAKPLISQRNFHISCLSANSQDMKSTSSQTPPPPLPPTKKIQTHTTNPLLVDESALESIPGYKPLTNELSDRIPKFPLGKETAPTLLPRPGVPRAGENGMTFGKMIYLLQNKAEPELIYEAEPHRLYFVICGCFALVFAFYAWNIGFIAFDLAYKMFQENNLELPLMHRYVNSTLHFGLATLLTMMPLAVMMVFVMVPTRLIRRMWYIPGVSTGTGTGATKTEPYVQFITHPLLPNSSSPVITIPLANLNRAHKSKVWTGRGFYGAIDSTIFFFLREKNSKIPWIVDRKGFIWGDGRVFDYLFGKESLEEAEKGITIDERNIIAQDRITKGEAQLKKELGVGWRFKAQGKLMKDDIVKLKDMMSLPDGGGADKNQKKSLPQSSALVSNSKRNNNKKNTKRK